MRIRYAAKTDVGMKRTHNEDYFSLIEDEQLFLVADGMGGHASGEVASKMAAEVLQEFYSRTKDEDATWPYKMDRQLSYVENRLVGRHQAGQPAHLRGGLQGHQVQGHGHDDRRGQVVGDKFYVAHVGDSRCYRIRGGAIQQMTRDHSLLEDYKDAKPDMTEEEQRNFPHKNVITRALGMRETVQVDVSPTTSRTATSSCSAPTACRAWSTTRRSPSWSRPRPISRPRSPASSRPRTRPAAPTTSPSWRCNARTETQALGTKCYHSR